MTHLVCTWRRTPHGTFSKPSSLATDDYEARNSSTRLGKCQVNPSEPSGQHTWHTTWRTTWHTMWRCAGDDRCRRPGLRLAQPNCHAANRSARGTAPRHDIWKALPVLSVSLTDPCGKFYSLSKVCPTPTESCSNWSMVWFSCSNMFTCRGTDLDGSNSHLPWGNTDLPMYISPISKAIVLWTALTCFDMLWHTLAALALSSSFDLKLLDCLQVGFFCQSAYNAFYSSATSEFLSSDSFECMTNYDSVELCCWTSLAANSFAVLRILEPNLRLRLTCDGRCTVDSRVYILDEQAKFP